MRRLIVTGAAALALMGCQRQPRTPGAERLMAATQAAVCAAPQTYAALSQVLFDQVARRAPPAARATVDSLAARSRLTIREAVLDSYDNVNSRTTCSGRLSVAPPAEAAGLAGSAPSGIDVRYTIQPSADGHSLVYGLEGAGALVDVLARNLKTETSVSGPAADRAPAAPPFNAQAVLHGDPGFSDRMIRVNAMLAVALARDITGKVRAEHAKALIDLDRCPDRACISAWLGQREAALSRWQE